MTDSPIFNIAGLYDPPMTGTEPAADATDSAPVVQRSRWSRLSYRIALLIAVLLAGSAIATTLFSVRSIQRETLQQSSQSVNNVHRGVTALIDTEARNTAQYATSALATRKKSLQDQSASATVALDTLRAAVAAGQISLSDAQAQALQMLKTIRFGENTYFFTYNRALTAISHPDPRYQGKNLRDLRDPDGKYILRDMQKLTDAKGSGFYEYRFTKLGKPTPQPKVAYVFNYRPWDWLIGTGVYIDDIKAEADKQFAQSKKELANSFADVKFAGGGVFFVLNDNGSVAVVPTGSRLSSLAKTAEGRETIATIEQNAPTTDGPINEVTTDVTLANGTKQAYVLNISRYIPNKWILVSAVPLSSLEAPGRRLAWQQLFINLIVLLIGLACGLLISRRIVRPVESVTKAAGDLADGSFDPASLEKAASRTDEVGELARTFQRMGREIVERERRLREQVAKLTVVIDRKKVERDVGEITETDFFQDLQARAAELRQRDQGKQGSDD
ncbi:MAG TPA: hypothetical protein DHW34_01385 [Actinobacteria bacterium]|nr:hypothetical protein [Actinomycetota bacterium]